VFAWLPHGSDFIWIFVFFLILAPASFVLWIAALISCVRNESSSGNTKVVWVVIIALSHFLGGLAYFLVRRPARIRELGH
jgi:hypothetical protein